MTPNRSTAVMQRRVEAHDSLDDFPTPPWATRALCEALIRLGYGLPDLTAREPAANRGHMVRPLREYFREVDASDQHNYGVGFPVQDYLFGPLPAPVDWTITNPPFRLAEAFIERAIASSDMGCAMLVRSAFTEGVGRHDRLFSQDPPSWILQFTERVPMHKGRLAGMGGTTATAYCWIIWEQDVTSRDTRFGWIPPCRKRLEKLEDYL